MQHKNPQNKYLKFLPPPNIICGEKYESSWVQVSLHTKKRNYNLVNVDYNRTAGHLTMQVTVKCFKVLYTQCNGGDWW